ncbi:MAG TPA: hypothetical protein VGA16_04495 [Candidatus Limnocylindria bacterium]
MDTTARDRPITRFALAAALAAAGAIHLALVGEHLEESVLLGRGFVVVGLAQIALGAIVLLRPRIPVRSIVALNVVLIALYALHVTIGLPLPDAAEAADEMKGLLGPREEVELSAIVTKLAELVGIVLAATARRDQAAGTTQMRRAA